MNMTMSASRCPLGGECGGTGWVWYSARNGPDEFEPARYEACECNPHGRGMPGELMNYLATPPVHMGTLPEPF